MKILGIETSCDETSAAILECGGWRARVLAAHTHSQEEHAQFGGVVPEVASRAHLEKIGVLVDRVLRECEMSPSDLDLIAVTDSPGLAGALLVGVSFALGLHAAHGVAVTGVNHLDGHISSLFIDRENLQAPFLVLVASGGHTAIYHYREFGDCEILGYTVDDAAGEAFDKIGKVLGFQYPAGRAIELEAAKFFGDNKVKSDIKSDIHFPIAKISGEDKKYCFSFSGLKTAVKNFIQSKDNDYIIDNRPQICFAFQKAVVDSLAGNLESAAEALGIKTVALAGGVACNGFLRSELVKRFGEDNVVFPPINLCTDNGAMIAMAGDFMYRANKLRFPKMSV